MGPTARKRWSLLAAGHEAKAEEAYDHQCPDRVSWTAETATLFDVKPASGVPEQVWRPIGKELTDEAKPQLTSLRLTA